MKLLKVTIVSSLLKEVAKEKIRSAAPNTKKPTDENGKDAEWYEDMGIQVPDFLRETKSGEASFIEFNKDDFEVYHNYTIVPLENLLFCGDNEYEGSVLYLKEDMQLEIKETSIDIEKQILQLTQTRLQKLISKLKLK